MRRLRALIRRRSCGEKDLLSKDTDVADARSGNVRKSLGSTEGHTASGGSRNSTPSNYLKRDKDVSMKRSNITNQPTKSMSSYRTINAGNATGTQTTSDHQNTGERLSGNTPAGVVRDNRRSSSPVSVAEEHEQSETFGERNSGAPAEGCPLEEARDVIRNLSNTVDTDERITYAPVITHETICPQVHEIIEEQIHRDVHNYDVYHRIQPVYDMEVLPARHFVPGPGGRLVEVSENDLPQCTGPNQNWYVGKRPQRTVTSPPEGHTAPAAQSNAGNNTVELEERHTAGRRLADNQEFKELYHDSWQSSAARAF